MKTLHAVFLGFWLCSFSTVFSQDYVELARKAYDDKKYNDVIDYANKALNLSASGAAYWYRGMSKYYLLNYVDAADDFTRATSYYTSDNTSLGSLYYWRALCRYSQGNYKDALPDFQLAIDYGYNDKMNTNWYMAYSNFKMNDFNKAIDFYTSAIRYASDNATYSSLYSGRADAEKKVLKNDEAMSDYTKAIDYNSSNSNAFWNRALCRASKFQYDLAAEDCTSAINLVEKEDKSDKAKSLGVLYNNRGYYRYKLEKYEEARADLDKSLSHDPNLDLANGNMGDVMYALKKYKDAHQYYLRAASLYKEDADRARCYNYMYWASRKMLDYTQALSDINNTIKVAPDSKSYYQNRAYVLTVKKEYTPALKDYDKVIDDYAKGTLYNFDSFALSTVYKDRALLKIKMKDNTGALTDLQHAVSLEPSYYEVYYELGRFYKQVMKENDLANTDLQKAADLSAKTADTTSSYVYAKVLMGDKQEAFRLASKLIKQQSDKKDRLMWELHNAACFYALAGDAAKAFQYLDKSFIAGFDDYDHLVNDRDLVSLMSLPQWKTLLAKYKVPQPK